jgi:hypothetical protein
MAEDERPSNPRRPSRPAPLTPRVHGRTIARGHEPAQQLDLDAGQDARTSDAAVADAGTRGDAGADAAVVLVGHYEGSDVTITRIPGYPDVTEKDPNAKTDVEDRAKGSIAITLINSATLAPICTLDADVHGDVATLRPGQSCFGDEDVSTTVTSGTARFTHRQLVLDMRLEVGADHRRGEIEYHFEGTRK